MTLWNFCIVLLSRGSEERVGAERLRLIFIVIKVTLNVTFKLILVVVAAKTSLLREILKLMKTVWSSIKLISSDSYPSTCLLRETEVHIN